MNSFKKIIAVISAFSMLFALASCRDEAPETTTTAAPVTTTQTVDETTEIPTEETATAAATTVETTTETTTETPTTTTAAAAATTTATTKKPTTSAKVTTTKKAPTTKKVTTTKKPTTTKKATTTKKKVTAPTKKEDIVKLYNSAAAKASTSKPGYKKSTDTKLSNLNMGLLASIDAVRETVGDFLGEGSTTETVKKGNFNGKSLVKSSLKAEDVTSATCKLSDDGKYYEISITVKNETNPLKGSSALGRFTKDYKDVDEIRSGLSEAGAGVGAITVKTTSVTIKAKINASNSRFVSITHNIKMSATLNDVKYSIAKVKTATADLETTVKYSEFKY